MSGAAEPRELVIEPDWERTCEWFAHALAEHAFDQFVIQPVVSFVEIVRYLATTDPEALVRIIGRLER